MILDFFNIIFSALGPIVFGLLAINLCLPRLRFSKLEILVIAYALGAAFISGLMFLLSLFGLNLDVIFDILLIGLAISAIVLIWRRKFFGPQIVKIKIAPTANKWKIVLIVILLLWIISQIFFVAVESWLRPIIQYDAVATWSLKAKIFFAYHQVILNPHSPYFLGAHLPNYPLHVPLLETWQALSLGRWQDSAIKIIFPLYYLGLIIIFGLNLLCRSSLLKTVIFTFFLSTLPLLVYHARYDYADLILCFYLLATLIYFWRGAAEDNYHYYYLAGIFAAISAWTKNEGLFLSLIIILSWLIYFIVRRRFNFKLLVPVLILIVLLLPWFIFKAVHHLGWENIESNWQLGWHPQVIPIIFARLFGTINWNIWWLIFIVSLITFWRQLFVRENLFVFLSVAGTLVFYLALYVFTPNNSYIITGLVDQRNLLAIIPLSIFYIGLLFSNNYDKIEL